jgi:hypothetical protein
MGELYAGGEGEKGKETSGQMQSKSPFSRPAPSHLLADREGLARCGC